MFEIKQIDFSKQYSYIVSVHERKPERVFEDEELDEDN